MMVTQQLDPGINRASIDHKVGGNLFKPVESLLTVSLLDLFQRQEQTPRV